MKYFIQTIIKNTGLAITTQQFWRYALIFWGILAAISYVQSTLVWLLSSSPTMYISESVQWFVTYLMWLALTPVMLFAAQRVPIRLVTSSCSWPRTILIHVLIASVLGFVVVVVSYGMVRPLHAYETGRWFKLETILLWYFFSYSLSVVTYLLVVVGYSIIVHGRQYQLLQEQNHAHQLNTEQLKSNLANARLHSLKMQLNPHFLFNTHHAIVSLMLQNDTRKAIDMLTALSDLLRGVLAHQTQNFLPLHEELNLTRQYLAIQQIRFQDRLRIEYDIASESEACPVPQLLLQPIVENAITHGVSNLTANALIRITTRKTGDRLLLRVADNGAGQHSRSQSGTGLGLINTRSRLQQAYNDEATLTFAQPDGGGTTVTLDIPFPSTPLAPITHDNLSLAYH